MQSCHPMIAETEGWGKTEERERVKSEQEGSDGRARLVRYEMDQ